MAPDRLREAIGDAGYQLADLSLKGSVSIPVSGMNCQKCVAKVKSAATVVDGVEDGSGGSAGRPDRGSRLIRSAIANQCY